MACRFNKRACQNPASHETDDDMPYVDADSSENSEDSVSGLQAEVSTSASEKIQAINEAIVAECLSLPETNAVIWINVDHTYSEYQDRSLENLI